jgi:anaerobilin synthase
LNEKPYADRRAFPTSFYPFLSSEFDVTSAEIRQFFNKLNPENMKNRDCLVYIHIPYCRSLCAFCGYYRKILKESEFNDEQGILGSFVDSLVREIELWGEIPAVRDSRITAVYIGGGTPSLIPPKLIERLIKAVRKHLPVPENTEFSFEGEVLTLGDPGRLEVLKRNGVTRVSFGVQSFQPDVRSRCNLIPTLADIKRTRKRILESGYALNIDLMYGLPGQTPQNFREDLELSVQELDAAHVDLYDTILYPNTELIVNRRNYEEYMPDTDAVLEMIGGALDFFREQNFIHLTSDDFVRPGHEYKMKHLNFGGEHGEDMVLAMGPTAVGFLDGVTYRNGVVESYLGEPAELPWIQRIRYLTPMEKCLRPFVFFPKLTSLNLQAMQFEIPEPLTDILNQQIKRGLVEITSDGEHILTRLGRMWVDAIALDYLKTAEKRRLFKVIQ